MCGVIRLLILAYFLGVCKGATKTFSPQDEIRSNYSSEMKSYINSCANPCEDFYEYACGNYNNRNPIQKYNAEATALQKATAAERQTWNEFLQNSLNETDQGEAFIKAKDFYESCINMDKINDRGSTPFIEYLRNRGGWPAIDSNWTENGKDWYKFHGDLQRMDEPKLLNCGKGTDMFNEGRDSLYILCPNMNLAEIHNYEEGSNMLNAYKTYLRDALKAFNVADDKIEAEFKDILDFEIKLANIIGDQDSKQENFSYKSTTLGDLEKNFTSIDWRRYLKEYFSEFEFNSSEQIIIYGDYLEKLDALLKNTSKRTILNYLGWQMTSERMIFLGNKFVEIKNRLNTAIGNVIITQPRLKTCIVKTKNYFEATLGALYAKRRFNQKARKDAEDFLSILKNSFRQLIEEADWIDSQSKINLNLKLDHLKLEVGYPDLVLNSTRVDRLYENITIKSDDYFGNMVKLETTSINTGWPLKFTVATAKYFPYVKMYITALMFQPPFYHKDFPKFINFAGIGLVTAHEMSHAFDTGNIKIDHKGDFNNILSNASLAVYKEKVKCFVEKYGNYSYNGTKLNGNRVLKEAIADDMGIKVAFLAYNKWLDEKKNSAEVENEELIGFSESKEKMFFLSYAQDFCQHITEKYFLKLFKTEAHAVQKYRVNGVLSNLKSFSDAYSCPVGSGMNPERKCAIW